jgi:glutamine amidotransferase
MMEKVNPEVAGVNYGMGNLFSVRQACQAVGLRAVITSEKETILGADGVILPGVGAFGEAMENLSRLDLIGPLRNAAESGKPLIGICLGMQLLMNESEEFGYHRGLGVISGPVVRFRNPRDGLVELKIPQIGWNRIFRENGRQDCFTETASDPWAASPLERLQNGEFMYFVHSFYPVPEEPEVVLSVSRYGSIEFCSSLKQDNVMAFQFHPERSGPGGLHIYRNLAFMLRHRAERE